MRYKILWVAILFHVLFACGQAMAIGPYTDLGDGTVTDAGTGLMWMQETADINADGNIDDNDKVIWINALSYCENLTLGNHSDWRLPDIQELRSLVDYNRYDPVTDPFFSSVPFRYWSATTVASNTEEAWGILFKDGSDVWSNKSVPCYVRCVRSGLYGEFRDVPLDFWCYDYIRQLYAAGITSGCGNGKYCPENLVTRAQMAVFLERGIHGSAYVPPNVSGAVFLDVDPEHWAAAWIKKLYEDQITSGCGNGKYCPEDPVTRAQMAVFLLRAKHGADYGPPSPEGTFNDVPMSYWAAGWIEQLASEGITSGCGNGNFCPEEPVTRAQMAVFLVRTFNLNFNLN